MEEQLLNSGDLKKLPAAGTSFADLRRRGMIYADKTDIVQHLAWFKQPYFLARPGRFGKSLLLSTFEALFSEGLKDFAGLKIDTQKDWTESQTWPVIRIDLSRFTEFADCETFKAEFGAYLREKFAPFADISAAEKLFGHRLGPAQILGWALDRMPYSSIVLLIDEYDAPLISCLSRPQLLDEVFGLHENFFNTLKSCHDKCRFTFITGLTRVARATLFSGFNIADDITFDDCYAALLGITEAELHQYFDPYVQNAAALLGETAGQVYSRLRARCGGYQFFYRYREVETVYNPDMVLEYLKHPYRDDGTVRADLRQFMPAGLLQYLRQQQAQGQLDWSLAQPDRLELTDDLRTYHEPGQVPLHLLLLQTGIFTMRFENWVQSRLVYPNQAAAEAMEQLKREILS